mmetsp:Transcript_3791/g.12534  ORF Transcript_3791/g.12534 Transcript_3791/m.12534 type:complete len:307 (+) Transcript_3791:1377-2297(+)
MHARRRGLLHRLWTQVHGHRRGRLNHSAVGQLQPSGARAVRRAPPGAFGHGRAHRPEPAQPAAFVLHRQVDRHNRPEAGASRAAVHRLGGRLHRHDTKRFGGARDHHGGCNRMRQGLGRRPAPRRPDRHAGHLDRAGRRHGPREEAQPPEPRPERRAPAALNGRRGDPGVAALRRRGAALGRTCPLQRGCSGPFFARRQADHLCGQGRVRLRVELVRLNRTLRAEMRSRRLPREMETQATNGWEWEPVEGSRRARAPDRIERLYGRPWVLWTLARAMSRWKAEGTTPPPCASLECSRGIGVGSGRC